MADGRNPTKPSTFWQRTGLNVLVTQSMIISGFAAVKYLQRAATEIVQDAAKPEPTPTPAVR